MLAVLSSPCPRSRLVSGAGIRCPMGACPSDRCPVSGVRCGRLSVQVSSVRPPVSGVRGFRRPLCPTGMTSWSVVVGQAAARLGWPGVGVVARRVQDGASSARGRSLALEAGAGHAGPAEGRLGRGRRRGRWAVARSTAWPTGRGWMRARVARRSVAGDDHAAWSSVRPGAGSPGRYEPSQLDYDPSVRPQPAVSAAGSKLATP
jgi:hypothetical protein